MQKKKEKLKCNKGITLLALIITIIILLILAAIVIASLTGENTLWQFGTGFCGNDYTLVGTYNCPFLLRSGYWGDDLNAGIFASFEGSGNAASTYGHSIVNEEIII